MKELTIIIPDRQAAFILWRMLTSASYAAKKDIRYNRRTLAKLHEKREQQWNINAIAIAAGVKPNDLNGACASLREGEDRCKHNIRNSQAVLDLINDLRDRMPGKDYWRNDYAEVENNKK